MPRCQAAGRKGSANSAAAHARAHHPQGASVFELDLEGAPDAVGLAPQERFGGGDALAAGAVQRERQAQPQRPVVQRRRLLGRRRIGARQ
jgi:hypothetical protein